MFNLRCTAKLLRRLKCDPGADATSTTKLGDWYGNLFNVGRKQYAVFTSERSLLTVLLTTVEIDSLAVRLAEGLGRLLNDLAISPAMIDAEIAQMQAFAITKTTNRSVIGSMNDIVLNAQIYLSESGLSLAETHRRLANMPMKILGYLFASEVALELLSADRVKSDDGATTWSP